ncbi:piggyBac transposable element-derived protein 4-like [Aphis gossypii]|uniref:piggyBac transposable element-derived protein 4-like n=1 Tax=Aphis gossypii TaxID=80765 RepID=UPI00215975E7|nr:piggyBac transposable element-derived protein 4-like [Aphis gossypii]
MPKLTSKLEVGQTESQHTTTMLATRWKDRRDVYMLTTQFENKMIAIGKKDHHGNQVNKPLSVLKYNENMGAIDKTDMLLSSIECVRKTIKWYKKLFFHLVDLSLLNAYSSYNTVTGKHLPLASYQFQLEVSISRVFKNTDTRVFNKMVLKPV